MRRFARQAAVRNIEFVWTAANGQNYLCKGCWSGVLSTCDALYARDASIITESATRCAY